MSFVGQVRAAEGEEPAAKREAQIQGTAAGTAKPTKADQGEALKVSLPNPPVTYDSAQISKLLSN